MLSVRLSFFSCNVSPIHRIGSTLLDKTAPNLPAITSLFSFYIILLSEWPTIHECISIETIDVDPV